MSSARSYEPTLDRFVRDMRAKLAKPENVAKPHWRQCDLQFLVGRLEDELEELKNAIDEGSKKSIRLECADIANFAMMISDWHR